MFGSAPCCSNSFKQRVFLSVSLPTARCIAATPLLPTRSGHAPCESSSCTDLQRNVSCYEGTHSMLTYIAYSSWCASRSLWERHVWALQADELPGISVLHCLTKLTFQPRRLPIHCHRFPYKTGLLTSFISLHFRN